jgi:DNA-binding response OmpR family regulator
LLVADDDETLITMVSRIATKAGYEVCSATDGVSALELAAEKRPDVILLDIMMPRMDGRDVLKKLKSNPETCEIPVIVFSARGEHSDRILGLELGADDYIEKPFNLEMLLRKLDYRVWKRQGNK